MDVGPILPGHSAGCLALWRVDLDGDISHWKGTGGICTHGGTSDCREETLETG